LGFLASAAPAQQSVLESTQQSPLGAPVVVGFYRDGDNNLDAAEGPLAPAVRKVTAENPNLQVVACDTTSLNGGGLKTYNYLAQSGEISNVADSPPINMADPNNLAAFVYQTLDEGRKTGAKQTWLYFTDHGAGDAGGLFVTAPDGTTSHMTVDQLASAIERGQALYAQRHPEDAQRQITGVVFHECFELTVAVASALSRVGVHYMAASPETTITPGVPAAVAGDIARYANNPQAMAIAIVTHVLTTRYREHGLVYGPTAAYDVLDISRSNMMQIDQAEKNFNDIVLAMLPQHYTAIKSRLMADARRVPGMQRDDPTAIVPWRSDRPAIALYEEFAKDTQLPEPIREAAASAAKAIQQTVIAHGETNGAVGFGANYRGRMGAINDSAVGPTTRFPTTPLLIDPLVGQDISETANDYAWTSDRNRLEAALLLQHNATSKTATSASAS
jgi:hypothetical protein